jgi:DNA-binding NtrC family response regulator
MVAIPTIFIADAESGNLFSCCSQLDLQAEYVVHHVHSEMELTNAIPQNNLGILLLDLGVVQRSEGFHYLRTIQERCPHTIILPVLPSAEPSLIKQMVELELYYFLTKPLDPLETKITIKRAIDLLHTLPPKASHKSDSHDSATFHGMIGKSGVMKKLFDLIVKIAADDMSTVLIRGESGTGKEMVAKAIHTESKRQRKNFVPVNCAAIPDDLLESELFGYTKGAFTGATSNKLGRIQYADQGTLFLDEIGDMKSVLQAKLLRVIQEKEFEPVGAFKSIPVNTRILAATHCDLEALVHLGQFREDLYYRLSVIPLHIPALRERTEDIPPLIDHFLVKYAEQRGREPFVFTPKAMAAVMQYEWRGNVRELENLIQHMSILYGGRVVEFEDLPPKLKEVEPRSTDEFDETSRAKAEATRSSEIMSGMPSAANFTGEEIDWAGGAIDFNELINSFETQLILQALRFTEGNKKEAARILKLKRTTLLEKIKKKDIDGLWEKQ